MMRFLFGYLVFGLAHLSVSFSNDYFDRFADRNSEKTAFSGGSKVLVEYPELERLSLKIAVSLLVASIFGVGLLAFAFDYSPLLVVFGSIGCLAGWFYTAPPLRLAYRGFGELLTMLAVGFLMPGMGYLVASGSIDSLFAVFIFPLSCYGLLFILTVEMPDVENDAATHKTNSLVKWGARETMTDDIVWIDAAVVEWVPRNATNNAILQGTSYFQYLTPDPANYQLVFRILINDSVVNINSVGNYTTEYQQTAIKSCGSWTSEYIRPNQSTYTVRFQIRCATKSNPMYAKDINILLEVMDGLPPS